MQQITVC